MCWIIGFPMIGFRGLALASVLCFLLAGSALAQKRGSGDDGGGSSLPPPVGTWQRTVNRTTAGLGVPLLLTDGTVIIQVPQSRNWWKLTPDVNGNYVNGIWTQIG